jgi:hypothetical protein
MRPRQQHGLNRKARCTGQDAHHNLALSDKQALTAHQVGLADLAIAGNARVIGIANGDQLGQGLVLMAIKSQPLI